MALTKEIYKQGGLKMLVSIEQKVENIKRIIVDCVKEEFTDSLPGPTITVYRKHPKYISQGEAEFALRLNISDDSLDDEAFKSKTDYHLEQLVQRILDKASTEYRDSRRYPGNNHQIRYLGQVLSIGKRVESLQIDESDFLEIAEIVVRRNWFYKIEIDKEMKEKIILLSIPEIVDLLPELIDLLKGVISEL